MRAEWGGAVSVVREPRVGVLLVNLGTPDTPSVKDVRRYLREFLGDPRVLDVHPVLRWYLLNLVFLPFRPRRSAAQYASIWTAAGSPLLLHSRALTTALQQRLGSSVTVDLAMRYGQPTVDDALDRLMAAAVDRIIVVPLYPQYASSAGGTAIAHVMRRAAERWNVPPIEIVADYFDDPRFIEALCRSVRPVLDGFDPDFVLMSYHGVPERQVRKSDPSGDWCLQSDRCCEGIDQANRWCYRAQCFATSRHLAAGLGLASHQTGTAFQSRLGSDPWIRPHTDRMFGQLAAAGVRRLAVVCPGFAADCLETIEEIGDRGAYAWSALGGEAFQLVPCLNAEPGWVDALAGMIEARIGIEASVGSI